MVSSLCSRLNRCCYHCSYVIPLGTVYSLITWAWIVFSGTICIFSIGGIDGALMAALSSVLYGLVAWSYTSACFTDPGSPATSHMAREQFDDRPPMSQEDVSRFASYTVKDDGTERYCQKCRCKKPDRAHHCRSCQKCVLKMDHHCPWLATCVGLHNYKQFILFLLYTSVWCSSMCVATGLFLLDFFQKNDPEESEPSFLPINWIVLLVLSGVVALVVGLFAAWHVSLVLRNYTTIEHMEETRFKGDHRAYLAAQSPKDKFNIFDLGYKSNWTQVMGDRPQMWFLPIQANLYGDGFAFEISPRAQERLREQQSLHSFEPDYDGDDRFQNKYNQNLLPRDFRGSDEFDFNDRLLT